MTVEALRLAGCSLADAEQAAATLLSDLRGHPDLRRLLVLDDTTALVQHAAIYERLVTANRVEELLCVAIGPRSGDRHLQLPGNLGGTQGAGVLWVSDPIGIDWRVARSAVAIGRPDAPASGLDRLIKLLRVDEIFDRVREVMTTVPDRVASPGLRLAGADDEAAVFDGALALAIQRFTEPGLGPTESFEALRPSTAGGAGLAGDGELARGQAAVLDAIESADQAIQRLSVLTGVFRRSPAGVQDRLIEVGSALAEYRRQVSRLLQDASTTGEITDHQRDRVRAAGVRFPAPVPPAPDGRAGSPAAPSSVVFRTIADAVRAGDTLTTVSRRLTLSERELNRCGSASYLPDVEQRCPSSLVGQLMEPPERLPRRAGSSELRTELGLDAAEAAARELTDLVVMVANREWSVLAASAGEMTRLRIALNGTSQALTEYATADRAAGSVARRARLTRIGEALTPILGDLALRVLAAECGSPSSGGKEAAGHAHDRAGQLISGWTQQVQKRGMLSPPDFATHVIHEVQYATHDDLDEIREAVREEARGEMWQLCTMDELSALDAAGPLKVVPFVPRLNQNLLANALPPDTVWISSGSYAGLLRLVALQPGVAASTWGRSADPDDAPGRPGSPYLTKAP